MSLEKDKCNLCALKVIFAAGVALGVGEKGAHVMDASPDERPRRLDIDEDSLTPKYARFSCEPLERGFGVTLGNALRRVLLSSLQGSAITSVRIHGVLHEFSTIPGVMEDGADIVLNLKEVRLRSHTDGPRTLRLKRSGAGVVTAADLGAEQSAAAGSHRPQ